MTGFLLKGLLRDRSRSMLPILVVSTGVMLTVFIYAWIHGVESDLISSSANFQGGHVLVTTKAYAREADQVPNDLAYAPVSVLLADLSRTCPNLIWTPRIKFGGLLDIPDERGETRVQGPAVGLAVDLLGQNSPEPRLLNLKSALVQGRLPAKPGEILISDELAHRLGIGPGSKATLFTSDIYGSMATMNFILAGTVRFGVGAMDRGALVADISDIQQVLDMPDAAGEVLGFFRDFNYDARQADQIAKTFNYRYANGTETQDPRSKIQNPDDFAPVMTPLRSQAGLGQIFDLVGSSMGLIVGVFVLAMSLVLWNAGLMGSLRRYGELGLRLAIGEDRGHLYRSLVLESVMIGILGSILGTAVGLGISLWLQAVGFNISGLMRNASMMMPSVMRPRVTIACLYIGFIPGLFATILGAAISGLGAYRRQTARLVKELEN
jgi:putative ABC transport system permease protein